MSLTTSFEAGGIRKLPAYLFPVVDEMQLLRNINQWDQGIETLLYVSRLGSPSMRPARLAFSGDAGVAGAASPDAHPATRRARARALRSSTCRHAARGVSGMQTVPSLVRPIAFTRKLLDLHSEQRQGLHHRLTPLPPSHTHTHPPTPRLTCLGACIRVAMCEA